MRRKCEPCESPNTCWQRFQSRVLYSGPIVGSLGVGLRAEFFRQMPYASVNFEEQFQHARAARGRVEGRCRGRWLRCPDYTPSKQAWSLNSSGQLQNVSLKGVCGFGWSAWYVVSKCLRHPQAERKSSLVWDLMNVQCYWPCMTWRPEIN